MSKIITFLTSFSIVLFLGLLTFGLILSKKYSFREGVLCFLLLLINQVYLLVSPYVINPIMLDYGRNVDQSSLTLGEFATLLSLIPRTIETIAIAILVVGLYKMLAVKNR